jgi:hypothetical protein
MKSRMLCVVAVAAATVGLVVADDLSFSATARSSVTNAETFSGRSTGFLESIVVSAPNVWTGTVTVTSGTQTLLQTGEITAQTFRPRYEPCNSGGVALGLTNWLERAYLYMDTVTVRVTTINTNVSAVAVKVRVSPR